MIANATDDEIRQLRAAEPQCEYLCKIALGELRGGRMGSSRAEENQARARLTEIINARAAVRP